MKKIFLIIIVSPLFILSQEIYRGDILISDLSSECIDTTYIRSSITRLNPPEYSFKKDKLVYEITLTIKLYGNEYNYSKALALTFETPDNEITTIIVNQELYPMIVDENYEHVLNIQSRESGWVNLKINEWDVHNLVIKNNININFINYSFFIE